ncbi:hypothetical protein CBM2618_B70007 [Cupriavidus taiwanensis]|nr:hypothetical protein CBM2618_B70007 [Cupriavidus taiwanensis]SOZ91960.1 hypothetical protein CBM2622_B70013 [Cupriavidus taiwanensis]
MVAFRSAAAAESSGNSDSLHFVDTPALSLTLSRKREREYASGSWKVGANECAESLLVVAGFAPLSRLRERGGGEGRRWQ